MGSGKLVPCVSMSIAASDYNSCGLIVSLLPQKLIVYNLVLSVTCFTINSCIVDVVCLSFHHCGVREYLIVVTAYPLWLRGIFWFHWQQFLAISRVRLCGLILGGHQTEEVLQQQF